MMYVFILSQIFAKFVTERNHYGAYLGGKANDLVFI